MDWDRVGRRAVWATGWPVRRLIVVLIAAGIGAAAAACGLGFATSVGGV